MKLMLLPFCLLLVQTGQMCVRPIKHRVVPFVRMSHPVLVRTDAYVPGLHKQHTARAEQQVFNFLHAC